MIVASSPSSIHVPTIQSSASSGEAGLASSAAVAPDTLSCSAAVSSTVADARMSSEIASAISYVVVSVLWYTTKHPKYYHKLL